MSYCFCWLNTTYLSVNTTTSDLLNKNEIISEKIFSKIFVYRTASTNLVAKSFNYPELTFVNSEYHFLMKLLYRPIRWPTGTRGLLSIFYVFLKSWRWAYCSLSEKENHVKFLGLVVGPSLYISNRVSSILILVGIQFRKLPSLELLLFEIILRSIKLKPRTK